MVKNTGTLPSNVFIRPESRYEFTVAMGAFVVQPGEEGIVPVTFAPKSPAAAEVRCHTRAGKFLRRSHVCERGCVRVVLGTGQLAFFSLRPR